MHVCACRRWGGEISDSQVVGETELRWIVGRSVALAERNEAAGNFAVREGLMQVCGCSEGACAAPG